MIPPPSKEYLDFLAAHEPFVTELATALRIIVLEEAPLAYELLYNAYNSVAAGYSFTGKPKESFIHIAAYSRWINFTFNQGSELTDPGCILRGEGQWVRYIRISSLDDTQRPIVRRFVQEAVQKAKKAYSKSQDEAKAKAPRKRPR